MVRIFTRGFIWSALCVTLAIGLATAAQAQSITYIETTTSSDYSDAGLDLGNYGFWFAQFDAPAPVSLQPVDNNDRNSLPGWVLPDFTPGETFSSSVTSKGGQGTWATLTLPDGENGLSGAAVDSGTISNSNNTISQLTLGPGVPNKFYLHIVTDNTDGQHDPASRLRARAQKNDPNDENITLFDISGPNQPGNLAGDMDGSPDVYTFLYEGMSKGAFIKLQMNDGGTSNPITGGASIAGIMFDPIPEPSSAMLLMLGAFGCYARLRRRRD